MDPTDPPAISAPSTVDWMVKEDQRRFRNHKRLGWIGVGLGAGGLVGLAGFGLAAQACGNAPCAVPTLAMAGISGIAFITGDVMFHYGGLAAAYDGQRLGLHTRPLLGWAGVGLAGVSLTVGAVTNPAAPSAPSLQAVETGAAFGALGFGIAQLVVDDRAGRLGGVTVAPTAHGLMIAGRF